MTSATGFPPDGGQFGQAPNLPYPNQGPGYPPPPPAYGAYPQPYANPAFYPPPPMQLQQQQQQQQTVVINQAQPQYVTVTSYRDNYTCHIVFSCLVFWFCGWLFGGIAFILAISATSSNHKKEAKRLGKASLALSWIGLLVGLACWGIIIWAIVAAASTVSDYTSSGSCYYYTCGSVCYYYKSSYYTSSECYSYFSSSCYSNGYCYHD